MYLSYSNNNELPKFKDWCVVFRWIDCRCVVSVLITCHRKWICWEMKHYITGKTLHSWWCFTLIPISWRHFAWFRDRHVIGAKQKTASSNKRLGSTSNLKGDANVTNANCSRSYRQKTMLGEVAVSKRAPKLGDTVVCFSQIRQPQTQDRWPKNKSSRAQS